MSERPGPCRYGRRAAATLWGLPGGIGHDTARRADEVRLRPCEPERRLEHPGQEVQADVEVGAPARKVEAEGRGGEKPAIVTPLGIPPSLSAWSVTVPLNPFTGVTVTSNVADWPGWIVTACWSTSRWKSAVCGRT